MLQNYFEEEEEPVALHSQDQNVADGMPKNLLHHKHPTCHSCLYAYIHNIIYNRESYIPLFTPMC